MNDLTWNDVKVGDVYIDSDGDACWRSAYNESTHHTDGVCDYDEDTVVIRVIGPMNPDWIDWGRGYIEGFTIPDEVLNPKPKGKPAVEFNPGEWFKTEYNGAYLKLKSGCLHLDEYGRYYATAEKDLVKQKNNDCGGINSAFARCLPCELDFEIVEYKGGKTWKELSVEYERAINELIMFVDPSMRYIPEHPMAITEECIRKLKERYSPDTLDHIDEGEDSEPEQDIIDKAKREFPQWKREFLFNEKPKQKPREDLIGKLIRSITDVGLIDLDDLRKLAYKARDQYERMKEEALDEVLSDTHGLTAAYAVGRDHGRNEQPTIPQEVRDALELLRIFSDPHSDYTLPFVVNESGRRRKAALQALTRCAPPKPHPLTKVREVIQWLESCCEKTFDKGHPSCELILEPEHRDTFKAARRELQEYDGEVGDE